MRSDPGFADRHQRIRDDHATETAEDYAEAVQELCTNAGRCRVVDLARHFGVSHVTVTKIVKRLQREGFVESEPYGPITLTASGKELANNSRRRHRIVFEFLITLGVDERTALVDAEGIEHHVSPETLKKLEEFSVRKRPKPAARGKGKGMGC